MIAPRRARAATLAAGLAACLGAGLGMGLGAAASAAPAASEFDWDVLGREFCARTLTGSVEAVLPLLTDSLRRDIAFAFGRDGGPVPATLFQTYANDVPVCGARTRNAALIEITRSGRGGAPAWTEYLVVVPEADGTTRIDDVLFGTRRSDTLRNRLRTLAN